MSQLPHRLAVPPMPRQRRRPRLHGPDCPCCRPAPGPADRTDRLGANAIARWSLAGFATGVAIVQLHAWATGGAGVALIFGFGL